MTAHSPVGLHPDQFDVQRVGPVMGPFADNDLYHEDPLGADHEQFSDGLRKSLFNFMHGIGLDFPLKKWFSFPVPPTSIPRTYIERAIAESDVPKPRPNALLVWPGHAPSLDRVQMKQGKRTIERAELLLSRRQDDVVIDMPVELGDWLTGMWPKLSTQAPAPLTYRQFQIEFEQAGLGSIDQLLTSESWSDWKEAGLLLI
jgi:hypothetical protein